MIARKISLVTEEDRKRIVSGTQKMSDCRGRLCVPVPLDGTLKSAKCLLFLLVDCFGRCSGLLQILKVIQ